MRNLFTCLFALFLILAFAGQSLAQQTQASPAASGTSASPVPRLIKFSGVLLDHEGQPLKGPVGVTFSLYAQQSGDSPLWMETQNVELDEKGVYAVLLGANTASGLPEEMFRSGEARWLGVQPEREPELPRVLLVSVPYALKAGDAQTLGGLPPSAFAPANFSAPANAPSPPSVSGILLAAPGGQPEAPTNGIAALAGGGTTNFIPLWTNSTTLGNSILFQSTTSNVNVNGSLSMPALRAATSSAGANSQPLDLLSSAFSSSTHTAVSQHFRWQAEPVGNNTATPSGKLNLLYAAGTAAPAETGLSISNKGLITFASGQTLPTVTGNETVTGNVSANQLQSNVATGTAPFVVRSTTQVANLNASFLGGLAASSYARLVNNNLFLGPQTVSVNTGSTIIGDPLCPNPPNGEYGGIGFKTLDCTTYAIIGDGVDTFVNAPSGNLFLGIGNNQLVDIVPHAIGIGTAAQSNTLLTLNATTQGSIQAAQFVAGFASLAVSAVGGNGESDNTPGGDGGHFTGGNNPGIIAPGLGGMGIVATGGTNTDGTIARAGEFHGDVEVTGCLSVSPGTTSHVQFGLCLSDVRLKKNIQPFPAVLDNLVRLQPVSYNWKVEEYPQFRFSASRDSGLLAQEVEKVFPEMVSVDQAGFKRVNYGELPLLMLQAVRELHAENIKLQEEMKAREAQWEERFRVQGQRVNLQQMQQQVADLEARLARVEARGGSN